MRIAFLCSSLEPGKDGVGDYTRMLAGEFSRQGHVCRSIALNDRPARDVSQVAGTVPEMRLPAELPMAERMTRARAILDDFAPDWISLQFVPYGFDDRGLVRGLARQLSPLCRGRRLHVMAHELWIGAAHGSSLKDRLVGGLQRSMVRSLFQDLRPDVVQTSNQAYVMLLKSIGIKSARLPMFGSIPICINGSPSWIWQEMREAGIRIDEERRAEFLLFGLFGGLHTIWPPQPAISVLADAGASVGRKVAMLSIGRMGAGEALWEEVASTYSGRLHFCKLGPRTPEEISQYFQVLDAGIATSPVTLIGKSATAAAMLDHGLPVIVNRDDVRFGDWPVPEFDCEPLLHRLNGDLPEKLRAGLPRARPRSHLPETASAMMAALAGPVPASAIGRNS